MKKILNLTTISIIVFLSNISFCQVDSLAKANLDTLIYKFVNVIDSLNNLSPEEELRALVKGPYETTAEFNQKKKKIRTDFATFQRKKLKDTFDYYASLNILAIVKLDSVKYDADKKIAKTFHRNIKIPNEVGIPKMDCFAYPVLKYPFSWKTKEGFGLTKTEINLSREIARDNDIIKSKGQIEYTVKFFRGRKSIPSLRIIAAKWKVRGKTIWSWTGNTRIPNGIDNKPLYGSD